MEEKDSSARKTNLQNNSLGPMLVCRTTLLGTQLQVHPAQSKKLKERVFRERVYHQSQHLHPSMKLSSHHDLCFLSLLLSVGITEQSSH